MLICVIKLLIPSIDTFLHTPAFNLKLSFDNCIDLNFLIYAIFNAIPSYVITFLFALLQIQNFDFSNPIYLINFLIFSIISYAIYLYCVFVNAYLLGTIAPPCEG